MGNLFLLSIVVAFSAGVLTTGATTGVDESTFDPVTAVKLLVAESPAPLGFFDVETTVAACFSAPMAAHLATLSIAVDALGSSASTDPTPNALRLLLLRVIVAFGLFRFRVPGMMLLSWSSDLKFGVLCFRVPVRLLLS